MKRININSQQTHFIGCWNLENNKLCNEITQFFENNKELQIQGITAYGKDLKAKKTTDIPVNPHDLKNPKFEVLKQYMDELYKCFASFWFYFYSIMTKICLASIFDVIKISHPSE